MKETKVIFTQIEEVKNKILTNNKFEEKNKTDDFIIYEGYRELYKDEEKVILVYFNNFLSSLNYIKENYDIFKIVIASIGTKTGNLDIKSGDVIIPNTFISKKEESPIFTTYAIGENYDLTKFGLILSGLCISGEPTNEDSFDVCENNIYDILSEIKKKDLLDKTTTILGISFEKDDDTINNTVNIIELML